MDNDFDQIRLRDLIFFDRLTALGSITATATELGVPKPTASRWLMQLEQRVGQSLVRRNTRHLALTQQGLAFHLHVKVLLTCARQAQAALQTNEPSGTLRVSVPVPFGRLVGGSVIARFRSQLPKVRLEIALQNRRVDLVRDGFDLAIRGGPLVESELVARRLATVPMWLYTAAEFAQISVDKLPAVAAPGDEPLFRAQRPALKLQSPSVIVDDREAVADALILGVGVGVLPAFLGEPARSRGELVRCFERALTTMPVHALYRQEQRQDARLRVLIDTIEMQLERTINVDGARG